MLNITSDSSMTIKKMNYNTYVHRGSRHYVHTFACHCTSHELQYIEYAIKTTFNNFYEFFDLNTARHHHKLFA